ncbi:MAG TPA: lycopene cyclase family protein [Frankiaceae bacterium]|nr:lycopene cyclase family protein [Frankiaceae bacterium]
MRWDAVIAGGGASGLSLACHLAAGGWGERRVLVVDDGSRPLAGRRWAFWSTDAGLLGDAVRCAFDRLRVHAAGRDLDVPLDRYRYRVVAGPDLRRRAAGILARAPGFRPLHGHVESVRDTPDGAEVVVDGRPVRARWAFDSVLDPPAAASPPAVLSFAGWEVETDVDAFDPVPVLLDFRTPQDGEVRFVYVLPSGPRRALVEHTRFGAGAGAGAVDADGALADYLGRVVGARSYRVVRRESGVLPLRVPTPRPVAGHVLPIGVRGGMLKASTGYAYARIQRDSAAIASSLARHGHPFDLPRARRRHRFLDAVLLDVLVGEPARLEQAFQRLFSRNPGDRVLRFLDEGTSPVEEALLVATLPPAPFLRAAGRWSRSAWSTAGRR